MTQNKTRARALIGTLSALGMAVSTAASAVDLGTVGDTKLSFFGYVKLDMMYDVSGVKAGSKGLGDSVAFGNVAVDGDADTDGHFTAHARQTRFGFKTATPTDKGDLTTVIEGDFWGSGNFRMRHAYGSWNGITAGQTWSNFTTFIGTTETLDFTSQLGRGATNRQAQLRYSSNGFHIALEDSAGAAAGTAFTTGVATDTDRKNGLPDVTLRYEGAAGGVKYGVAGVFRQVGFDDGVNDDSATGWGLTAAVSKEIIEGTTIRAHVTGGDGIGYYMYSHSPVPVAFRSGNELETMVSMGATVGLTQKVGPGRINLAYSYASFDWDDAVDAGLAVGAQDETRQLAFLNYIWKPYKSIDYGVELIWMDRETVAGASGDALRLQGSVIYSF